MFTYCQYGEATGIKGIECPPECWVLDLEDIEANTGKILKIVAAKDRKSTSGKYLFSKNMVLYSKLRPYLNKVVVATNDGCCTTEIIPISLFTKSSPHFLQLLLMSPMFVDTINADSYGVKMPRADTAQVKSFLLPIPPKNEQQRIVEQFDKLLPYIESYKESQASLEAINTLFAPNLKKSILQHAIQGKLVPQDPNDEPASVLLERIAKERAKMGKKACKSMSRIERRDRGTFLISPDGTEKDITADLPFDIPYSWEWCLLDELGETNIGLTYKPADIKAKGVNVLRANNIQDGKICYEGLIRVNCEVPQRALIHKGDLLICARNGSKKLVGKTALIERDGDAFGAFMAKFSSPINDYLYYFLNSQFFREQLDEANTTTIYQVTQSMLRNTICPLPPLAEQRRICQRLEILLQALNK